jgi:hypothetical protein
VMNVLQDVHHFLQLLCQRQNAQKSHTLRQPESTLPLNTPHVFHSAVTLRQSGTANDCIGSVPRTCAAQKSWLIAFFKGPNRSVYAHDIRTQAALSFCIGFTAYERPALITSALDLHTHKGTNTLTPVIQLRGSPGSKNCLAA